jgi:2OG-Fe(II) oxygenase superfamily
MSEVIVIDDIIPKQDQIRLYELMSQNNLPYQYNRSTVVDASTLPKNSRVIDSSMIVNVVVFNEFTSPLLREFVPIIAAIPFKIRELLRVKVNITHPHLLAREDTYNVPHVDYDGDDLITAIYYLNDSDGDTYIFDQDRNYKGDDLTVKKQISPKQGRMVVFSGDLLHSGNNPRSNETRMVANINVRIIKE